ncbi:MAG: hypothetical protein ACD_33C00014G0008 [uncultured bacterium]|nr:MAG: hypothetical protein ACD_33C00014G0008 [uncultured bacterium]
MKEIKGFCTRDDFTNNVQSVVTDIYEISDYSLSFAKYKQSFYDSLDAVYSLHVFKLVNATSLTQEEVNKIFNVLKAFSTFITSTILVTKQQILISFLNSYNTANPTQTISELNYNVILEANAVRTADYITFNIGNELKCSIWLSNETFTNLYPDYEVGIVLPFNNFTTIVNNPSDFVTALDNFNLLDFNINIEEDKDNVPTSYTKILNIPYNIPNTNITKNCYFAFNIYGQQGNYEYILKLQLFNYLTNTLLISETLIQQIFPTLLNINEFFFIPRWDKVAIPSQVGTSSINSQVALTYQEPFDINKFIKVYTDVDYFKANTYSLPIDYNNLLIHVVNGFYTEFEYKDFKQYYSDIITVFSSHPDFARMSTITQNFMTLLENLLITSDVNNSTELFNKMITNTNYEFKIINRDNVDYLTIFNDKHQLYILPKYEFMSLN